VQDASNISPSDLSPANIREKERRKDLRGLGGSAAKTSILQYYSLLPTCLESKVNYIAQNIGSVLLGIVTIDRLQAQNPYSLKWSDSSVHATILNPF